MKHILPINEGWAFVKGCETAPAAIPAGAARVDLPHCWNALDGQDGGSDYWRGPCCYLKTIEKPAGKNVYVEVEAASSVGKIIVNGVEKASAVKDKLIEMTHLNETLYCCGIACSSQGFKTKAGNYQIDLLLANVCKQNVTRFPYEIVRLAEDVAGGLVVTMPSQKDFHSDTVVGRNGETIGEICNKFFATREGVSTENRQRILRFIENLCLGAAAVGYRTESMHGAGSPQAQRIMIARQGNIQGKKQLAKDIAGITD